MRGKNTRGRIFIAILVLMGVATALADGKIMIFGGPNHDVYLGCLSCSEFASDSVFNEFGAHGSIFRQESIWNPFGAYGSQFRETSACNPFASDPPVIVDEDGEFYGYLSLNIQKNRSIQGTDLLGWLEQVVCEP